MTRKLLIIIVFVLLAAAGWLAYKQLYSAPESLSTVKASATITADELLSAFERDSATANRKYLGKVIEVSGKIKSLETTEDLTVILQTGGDVSSIRCSMDSTQADQVRLLKTGSEITIRGNCTGYNADELLGADVILNRCVVAEDKNK